MEGCQARDLPDWEAWEAGGLSDMKGCQARGNQAGKHRKPEACQIWKVSSKRQSGWEAWEAGGLTDMERYQAKGLSGEET